MNQDQVSGIIRHVLTTIGGITVMKGWMDEEAVFELTGLLMSIFGFVWSFTAKRKANETEEA